VRKRSKKKRENARNGADLVKHLQHGRGVVYGLRREYVPDVRAGQVDAVVEVALRCTASVTRLTTFSPHPTLLTRAKTHHPHQRVRLPDADHRPALLAVLGHVLAARAHDEPAPDLAKVGVAPRGLLVERRKVCGHKRQRERDAARAFGERRGRVGEPERDGALVALRACALA
jgi:hypothetical protein